MKMKKRKWNKYLESKLSRCWTGNNTWTTTSKYIILSSISWKYNKYTSKSWHFGHVVTNET
jgi:hypothetical protein